MTVPERVLRSHVGVEHSDDETKPFLADYVKFDNEQDSEEVVARAPPRSTASHSRKVCRPSDRMVKVTLFCFFSSLCIICVIVIYYGVLSIKELLLSFVAGIIVGIPLICPLVLLNHYCYNHMNLIYVVIFLPQTILYIYITYLRYYIMFCLINCMIVSTCPTIFMLMWRSQYMNTVCC